MVYMRGTPKLINGVVDRCQSENLSREFPFL